MKRLILIVLIFQIFGCRSIDFQILEKKEFIKKGIDFNISLILSADGKFILKEQYKPHGYSECEGRWKIQNKNILLLNCLDESPHKVLSSNYMPKRKHSLKIITARKLKFDSIVLKQK